MTARTGYHARVLADSVGPNGIRITTVEATFPRFILAEVNTHRVLSRNAASSRAIPVEKLRQMIASDPFVPLRWLHNERGMQGSTSLSEADELLAIEAWLTARDSALEMAGELSATDRLNVHKQTANRLLEPFGWVTDIITATEWANFFGLRCHAAAQPEFRKIAEEIRRVREASTPVELLGGEWHLPLIGVNDEDREALVEYGDHDLCRISTGRCARVSYLTHDGIRNPGADIALHNKLKLDGHMSPFEHQAQMLTDREWDALLAARQRVFAALWGILPHAEAQQRADAVLYSGNLRGVRQYRKTLHGEAVFTGGV
jgi:uncharacterized protein YjhX (UPF0386 family)